MNKSYLFLLFSLFLGGCGENNDPFLTGGVSLGGTGNGTQSPSTGGGNTVPSIPSEDSSPIGDYAIWSPGLVNSSCNGLNISYQLLDNFLDTPVDLGDGTMFNSEDKQANLKIKVTVENTSNQTVYEYFKECLSPLKFSSSDQKLLFSSNQISCPNSEFVSIYRPSEIKTYYLQYNLPGKALYWNSQYESQYSLGQFQPEELRSTCSASDFNLNVEEITEEMLKN